MSIREFGSALAIRSKWFRDSFSLPLTRQHWPLYAVIHRLCAAELERFPDLVRCPGFNDKIQWLKLFDQQDLTVRCSDKLAVRDHVRERVGENFLVPIYQVCDKFADIDFENLPASFVIKANHDSGTVILVRDKRKLDFGQIESRINASLARAYGEDTGEWAYALIRPRVFVEQLIESSPETPPPDYKFHCVDGKVRWLQFISERGRNTKEAIVEPDGVSTPIHFDHNMIHSQAFSIPARWNEMKRVAEQLSRGFRYVRVDLYCTEQRILVGEMTFFPLMGCYKGDGQITLGRRLDFDRSLHHPLFRAHTNPGRQT
jgi:hypothetical protein